MINELLNENTKIKFINRPIAVPYNYRVIYKISQIVLILGNVCKRGGCSNVKLHMISNALSSHSVLVELEKVLENTTEVLPIVRFEPALTRALSFAIAEELVEVQANSKFKLTVKGKDLYEQIIQDEELMILEKIDLKNIKDKINDDVIDRIVKKWGTMNVTD
ncbi:MAG: hypothetical protein K1W33_01755 [Clostridia bacterium]